MWGFSDASDTGVGIAIYLRSIYTDGSVYSHLVFAQAKLAPQHATSRIVRLEICAAVMLAIQMEVIKKEIMLQVDEIRYFTDSTIVLGYISNDSRRFLVYVSNRVQCIRNLTTPEQWSHVSSSKNPADIPSRGTTGENLTDFWFYGPDLHGEKLITAPNFDLPEEDIEFRRVLRNSVESIGNISNRFSKFSTLKRLVCGVARIQKSLRREYSELTTSDLKNSEITIYKIVQREHFFDFFSREDPIEPSLRKLDPFLGADGLLRVGGRLKCSNLSDNEKHPIILPRTAHVARLVVEDVHMKTHHQGRLITAGAIRDAGFWILGSSRIVSKAIHECVFCRRVRGPLLNPKMADLPQVRTEPSPPFSRVALDVFGEWKVVLRKTRGHKASTKRWGLLLTCLYSRAVHIETLESMSMNSFLCALRRFIAIRGRILSIHCDNGGNFSAGSKEFEPVEKYSREQGIQWFFNPPYASHYGGVYERQIRTIRQVLNNMFLEFGDSQIRTEVLTTFLQKLQPSLILVHWLPYHPILLHRTLSPYTLLTGKSRPFTSTPEYEPEDVYAQQWWKRSQYLADQFWIRWRREYLHSLQPLAVVDSTLSVTMV